MSAELQATIQAAMERLHVPGVAVGLLHEGVEETAGFGVTSVENPLPVTPDTLFQIGSITKTVTATAIMCLVERGRLDLEAPIRGYLPELRLADPDVTARVALRHVLTHTAGWVGDDFTDTGAGDDALSRYVAGMAELPQLTPLGELWSYCNSGFALAGRIIEVVSGKPYEVAARELVLEPLGMAQSFFFPGEVMTHRFVVGHFSPFEEQGQVRVARPWTLARAANPEGGLVSTVPDMLRYARFHLGGEPAGLLSPTARRRMQSPLALAGNFADAVGVAWMLRSVAGVQLVEHGGSTHGQQATFKLVPKRGFALVVLTNSNRGAELGDEVADWALRRYLGIAETPPSVLDLPASQLAAYTGQYAAQLSSIELTIGDGHLVATVTRTGGFPTKDSPPPPAPPPGRFAFWAEDRLLGLDPPWKGDRAEFVRDASGRVAWLRFGGRLAARQPGTS